MRNLSSALLTLPLLAPAVALAQAPGEAPAVVAAPTVGPTPAARAPRFSVGLAGGASSFGVSEQQDAEPVTFQGAELALRYRVRPNIELEVVAGGGRQTIDGVEGDLALGSVTVGARYRLRPYAAWDYYVGAGVGGTIIARKNASEQERSDATRGHGQISGGIERRFGRLAVGAELRLIAAGQRSVPTNTILPVEMPVNVENAESLVGATFTLGASLGF